MKRKQRQKREKNSGWREKKFAPRKFLSLDKRRMAFISLLDAYEKNIENE